VSAPDFAARLELHRGEIQVHCYRMLGSLEDSEDLVQETFLRAWRHRATFTFDGPSALRAWLYRIATNACLDFLRGRPRRILPMAVAGAADPNEMPPPPVDLPWLQPYPDRLLQSVAPPEDEPATAVVARETIELAFIAAIQHLPPRQRAVLLLRDVLGWSARDTAALIEASVAAVNSALQRARATLKDRLPRERTEWTSATALTEDERGLLKRYLDAHQQQDGAALAALLREDARLTMPPHPAWYDGRDAIVLASEKGFDPDFGTLLSVAVGANTQPAVAHYLKAPGGSDFRPLAFDLLRIDDGQIAEINSFVFPQLFGAFGLPARR
jgi:RNA polymerase sigma-70 factor (ECF subfamily)